MTGTESTTESTTSGTLSTGVLSDTGTATSTETDCPAEESGSNTSDTFGDDNDWTVWVDAGTSSGNAVAIDACDDVVVGGSFASNIDIGDEVLESKGGTDALVIKYGSNGSYLWARSLGGPDHEGIADIVTDHQNNVIATGSFTVEFTIDDVTLEINEEERRLYLVKFNSSGDLLWAKTFPGEVDNEYGGLTTDADGNIIVTGGFRSDIDFGGGPLENKGGSNFYVVKFSSAGGHMWSHGFGTPAGGQKGNAVVTDTNGEIIVVGDVGSGTVDFGGAPVGNGAVALKLDPQGGHIWSVEVGDGWERGDDVALDSDGSVFLTGRYNNDIDLGGGPIGSEGDDYGVFLAKFDADSAHLWSKGFGDEKTMRRGSLTVDGAGAVTLVGTIANSTDFGGGPLVPNGVNSTFLAKFDGDGEHVWSANYGENATVLAVDTDNTDHEIITGTFSGTLELGPGVTNPGGSPDLFLARIDI